MSQETMLLSITLPYKGEQTEPHAVMLRFQPNTAPLLQDLLKNRLTLFLADLCLRDGSENAVDCLKTWFSQECHSEVEVFPVSNIGYFYLSTQKASYGEAQ